MEVIYCGLMILGVISMLYHSKKLIEWIGRHLGQ